jgi:stage V sporulation protein G
VSLAHSAVMQITDIRIVPVNEKELRGFATITFDNFLAVRDVRIIEGPKGLFLSMPSKKLESGRYKDIVHPINSEAREMLERAVIAEYKKVAATV